MAIVAPRTVLVLGDPKLPRLVELALKPGNFATREARSADDVLAAVAQDPPALVALDVRLRDGDGISLCERLRELADVPVIFISAEEGDASVVRALRCADDYVVRPFSLAQLRARAEAVLRRAHPCLDVRAPGYDDGYLRIDFAQHEVTREAHPVALTPTEYRLLTLLARHRGRLFLHDELLTRVWGEEYRDDPHLLRLHVANLRKKIEPDPARPTYVQTRHGLGYVFDPRTTPPPLPTANAQTNAPERSFRA